MMLQTDKKPIVVYWPDGEIVSWGAHCMLADACRTHRLHPFVFSEGHEFLKFVFRNRCPVVMYCGSEAAKLVHSVSYACAGVYDSLCYFDERNYPKYGNPLGTFGMYEHIAPNPVDCLGDESTRKLFFDTVSRIKTYNHGK